MAKKTRSFKGLGARYGIKIRKKYSIVHKTLKSKENVLNVDPWNLGDKILVYGIVKNVGLR